MSKKVFKWFVIGLFLFGLVVFISIASPVFGSPPNSDVMDSEIGATPNPTPTPMTPPDTIKALEYIAAREGIPIETLIVANAYRREYVELGRAFWAVTALENKRDGRFFNVMIDLADGSFVDDVEAIEKAEEQARQAKYGQLEPSLYERLKPLQDEDQVPVAIWVAGAPRRSQEELYAELAALYPEVAEALQRSGKPFGVDDPELRMQIKAEYMRLLDEDTREQTQPLVDFLQARNFSVTVFEAMPAISATLPKALILEIASRPDVGAIYLVEEKVKAELDTAIQRPCTGCVAKRF